MCDPRQSQDWEGKSQVHTSVWSEEDPSGQLQDRGTRAGGRRDFHCLAQAEEGTSPELVTEKTAKPRPLPGALSSSQSSFLSLSPTME